MSRTRVSRHRLDSVEAACFSSELHTPQNKKIKKKHFFSFSFQFFSLFFLLSSTFFLLEETSNELTNWNDASSWREFHVHARKHRSKKTLLFLPPLSLLPPAAAARNDARPLPRASSAAARRRHLFSTNKQSWHPAPYFSPLQKGFAT